MSLKYWGKINSNSLFFYFLNFLLWNTLLLRKWRQCGAIVSYILPTIGQQVFYLFILWTISIVLCYGKNKIFDWMVPMLILLNAWKWLNFLIVVWDCQLETKKVKIAKMIRGKGKITCFLGTHHRSWEESRWWRRNRIEITCKFNAREGHRTDCKEKMNPETLRVNQQYLDYFLICESVIKVLGS